MSNPTDGAWLRAQRLRLGLTQAELARRLNLAPNHVARLERGEVPLQHQTRLAVEYLMASQQTT